MTTLKESSDLVIRPLADIPETAECAQLMSSTDPWITLGRSYEVSLRMIGDPVKEAYVATAGSGVLGFLLLNMQGPFPGYIQIVCVRPDSQRQGLGSRLVRFAEERIFRDSPNVFLCVSSFNRDAKRLYERLGYQVVGELKNYLVAGHSEILMRKSIGPWAAYRKT